MDTNVIYQGHVLDVLRVIPNDSIDLVITSPPYWGKRNYTDESIAKWGKWQGQLGLEPTYQDYIQHLVEVFTEVRRVLKPAGSVYLNLGDSYAGSGRSGGNYKRGAFLKTRSLLPQ